MTTKRAPLWRATWAAMIPIGPAPVISTSSATNRNWVAVWTALPNGSKIDATSRSILVRCGHRLPAGMTMDSDADGVCAQGAAARHAVAAAAADDVAFGTHDLAGKHRRHAFAQLDDLAHELVADHERRLDGVLGPLVPAVDVQVGAADACAENAKQHLTGPWLRLGDVLQPQA